MQARNRNTIPLFNGIPAYILLQAVALFPHLRSLISRFIAIIVKVSQGKNPVWQLHTVHVRQFFIQMNFQTSKRIFTEMPQSQNSVALKGIRL